MVILILEGKVTGPFSPCKPDLQTISTDIFADQSIFFPRSLPGLPYQAASRGKVIIRLFPFNQIKRF